MSTITYAVTVVSAKFLIDGSGPSTKLTFRDGDTYIFDQSHSSNAGHILQFSTQARQSTRQGLQSPERQDKRMLRLRL